ncbi:MAG: transglycosylase SLT domain-containing protein [Deltaproteobacteria bacterium]|nr:transglycosylase SLT domain-containing protein [Deltaproteobacteria bacterium]
MNWLIYLYPMYSMLMNCSKGLLLLFLVGCATTPSAVYEGLPISQVQPETSPEVSLPETMAFSEREYPSFDIPIVVNQEVDNFIRYFQKQHRKHFVRWLSRSSRYIPVMKEILSEHGLPTDLVYLAMIESGFNHQAQSWAHAVGPWQFIRGTAKRYGLKTNWWIDERRDPIKSTVAAAQYLRDLYDMFDSWFLAAAGYNAGENKIKRAIQRHKTQDFWEMTRYRYLKRETKQYIPKLIATVLIAKNPEKYGFIDVEYKDPWAFDLVVVNRPVDLRKAASALDVSFEDLKYLNPELQRWCTPPDVEEYTLRIPEGKKETFLTHYDAIVPKEKTIFHVHKITSGDTLYRIARKYGTNIDPIMELNKIKSARLLRPGNYLIIPVAAQRLRET